MAGKSKKTVVVGFRIPNDVHEVLQRRIKGKKSRWGSVAEYLQDRIIYDVTRQHEKGKSSKPKLTEDTKYYNRRQGGKG
jgi:Zn/Cd-binding protein ZinT